VQLVQAHQLQQQRQRQQCGNSSKQQQQGEVLSATSR
jgi:hypothetical protein